MELGSYDSPTFLGQKDKYLLGLSLPELMIAMGVALMWFVVTLMVPYGMLVRLTMVVPATGISLFLLFGRIAGLSIPGYLWLMLVRSFSRPVFEETPERLLEGDSIWLEAQRRRAEGGSRVNLKFWKKKIPVISDEVRQAEMKAEMDKQIAEGAVAAEQWVRDGVKAIVKGF